MSGALQLINTGGLVVIALLTYLGNRQLHQLVNSRMTEMLELTRRASKAEGVKETEDAAAKVIGQAIIQEKTDKS